MDDTFKKSLKNFILQVQSNIDDLSEDEISSINQVLQKVYSFASQKQGVDTSIPKGAENLWILAGGNPNAFQSYLKTFPNPSFQSLYQNKPQLNNAVATLSNKVTLPGGEVQAGVPKADLNSSNIYGYQYDNRTGTLRVRFNGGGVYEYDNVPPFIYKMFERGAIPAKTSGSNQWGQWWVGKQPSLGASFWELIRDNFPYQRVA